MNRRDFLKRLIGGGAVTAAGLLLPYEPQRVYSFLTNNPLALTPFEQAQAAAYVSLVDQWMRQRLLEVSDRQLKFYLAHRKAGIKFVPAAYSGLTRPDSLTLPKDGAQGQGGSEW
jgi:hypothetical protein